MSDYTYEKFVKKLRDLATQLSAHWGVGRFILMFLLATIHGFRTESKPAKRL